MTDESVQIKFGAETSEATSGIDRIGNKLKDLNPEVRELAETFTGLRRTFVEAFAIDKIAEFINEISRLGEESIRASEMLGIGIEKVQELGFAARMVGGSTEGMTVTLTRLERNMAEAQNASSLAAKAFEALGISQEQLKRSSPEQVLGLIADKFRDTKDGADKTAIAIDLMGRSGAQMIPLLNQGSDGLEKMGIKAQETGSILNDFQAESLERTQQGIVTLKASVEGAGIALFEIFQPAIDTTIKGLTQLTEWLTEVFNGLRLIAEIIEASVLVGFAKMSEQFAILGVTGTRYIEEIGIAFQTLGQVIDDVAHGHFDKAVQDWENGCKRIIAAEKDATASILDIKRQYVDFKQSVMDATQSLFAFSKAEQETNKPKLHAPASGQNEEISTKIAIYQEQIKVDEQELQQKKEMLDAEVDLHKITKLQEIDQLKQYADVKYEMEMQSLEEESRIAGLSVIEKQKINNQIVQLQAQHTTQMLKYDAAYAKEKESLHKKELQQWKPILDTIGNSFDTMLKGVLQGTQTWSQAMGNFFINMAATAVESIGKIVAEWLLFEAVTYGQGTWADFMTIEKGGGGLNRILSFDVGSWSIPSDTMAMVHQGEMIIPAAQASAIRSGQASVGGGGSGDMININIQAIDTQTGAQFLRDNAGVIASTINNQLRTNNRKMSNSVRG